MRVQVSRAARLAAADDIIINDATTTLSDLAQRSRICHRAVVSGGLTGFRIPTHAVQALRCVRYLFIHLSF